MHIPFRVKSDPDYGHEDEKWGQMNIFWVMFYPEWSVAPINGLFYQVSLTLMF